MQGPPRRDPDEEWPGEGRPDGAGRRRGARAAVLADARRGTGLAPLLAGRWPDLRLGALTTGLSAALARELDDRRGFLFLPVGFALGAVLYFAAPQEPLPYAGFMPAGVFAALAWWRRERAFGFHLFALLAVIALGFAVAALQVQRMAHPVLGQTLYAAEITGFVESAEQRPRGSRITLLVTGFARPPAEPPQRVRVTLSSRKPPGVGAHVSLRATLGPPPGPAYPGGFDFGRAIWFDGIGATGFSLGRPELAPATGPPPWGLALATWLDGTRRAIAARIRAALPGEDGGVAVALVTGLRDAVAEPIEESMRIAGLSHILSISGLHMALVATTVFFLARALLALAPELALARPIKAWAALPAFASATFYLLLSGAEVPTQRAYVMTLLVLAGVVLGRPALTLRTLALAALALMALTPWAVLDPGAQMSFTATLALIAAYERFGRFIAAPPGMKTPLFAVPARYLAALVLGSLAAGLATAPYAAFHFQRLAPLSLPANLAATPVVSLVVMPFGLLGALLMPFGWDGPVWRIMGWGIGVMLDIADMVAALPGADRGIRGMPAASLALLSLALAVLCLARTRLMLLAPALGGLALWIAAGTPRPELLVDAQGRTVAVRGTDGRLHVMGDRAAGLANRFAVEQWLSADGDRTRIGAKDIAAAATCDPLGCTLPLADGGLVALSRQRDSLEDDCRLARVLVTPFEPPLVCAAELVRIDPSRPMGGLAGYHTPEGGWRFVAARPAEGARPWEARSAPVAPEAGGGARTPPPLIPAPPAARQAIGAAAKGALPFRAPADAFDTPDTYQPGTDGNGTTTEDPPEEEEPGGG
ncbi:ComEC family competence protein [Starkeya koreensis]|uniref:ComEC family competence protein n=1 Tax=Ancylobacter koreensis TaxID=266121 RepID=A0ABT0DMD8_9HYPH|nr:ComEC/Rec2 family competence protein [Ancylobacter koreensis]MCK0208439.1 ComEC family competence protein [Ancylobacter koreensis]